MPYIPEEMKKDIDYQMSIETSDDPMIVAYGNPYNPFDNFIGWWKYDYFVIGWDTCGILARNVASSRFETDEQKSIDTLDAMRELVQTFPRIFRIVKKSDYEDSKISKKITAPYGGAS